MAIPEKSAKLTPLMKQYFEIKAAHQDKLMFFRMGDFFELFFDDAVRAAPILGITLTSRNKKSEDETPMCGFPHHQLGNYVNKLLAAGHRVAICDQLEDAEDAVGIVKRGVSRVLSPGMVFDPDSLDGFSPLYICGLEGEFLSFLETTTGEAFYFKIENQNRALSLIEILRPTEFLWLTSGTGHEFVEKNADRLKSLSITMTPLDSLAENIHPLKSCALLIQYARSMQGDRVAKTIHEFELRESSQGLKISPTALRHLELFENYSGEKGNTLYAVINQCQTPPGARLLKNWMRFPLGDQKRIGARWDTIEKHAQDFMQLTALRKELSSLGDLERRFGKLSSPSLNPRDLYLLGQSLRVGLNILERGELFDKIQSLYKKLDAIIEEDPPVKLKDGKFIKKGFSPDLDKIIYISENGQHELLELEKREREATGIPSLKVSYNGVFGYFIEVTKTHIAKAPTRYIRKQTLVNAERFLTPELQDLESKILSARVKRVELESEIFETLRTELLEEVSAISRLARVLAETDVLSNLAFVALQRRYVRPQFSSDLSLDVKKSRHPVVETQNAVSFIPNDIVLKPHECLLLTGPNMAGKSTLMRQAALINILAQMGSFVPAESATLPLLDAVYTRIGASDSLAQGLSTFMVEMTETAQLLSELTPSSLVILDEIGRGTSTYDGLSLAQSILEYLVKFKKPLTFFATHYHEIAELEDQIPGLKNSHMLIKEKQGKITFLYTLVEGAAEKSYGIEVAELAGVPMAIIERAKEILATQTAPASPSSEGMDLFSWSVRESQESPIDREMEKSPNVSPDLFKWSEEIRSLDLNQITPLEALNRLAEAQKNLR